MARVPMTERRTLSASTLKGDPVRNTMGEDLGKVEDLMIDLEAGRVAYVVLSFGGFLGLGEKLFAVPWDALTVDMDKHAVILDVPKERLKEAPGFDKNNWPDFSDQAWGARIFEFYRVTPYWE